VQHKVFVYGTLRSGRARNGVLEGSQLLGRILLTARLQLVNLGPFPALIPCGRPLRTMGEVYEVSDEVLALLDRIEGHPDFYKRIEIETQFGRAWVYVIASLPANRYSTENIAYDSDVLAWEPSEEERAYVHSAV